MGVLGALGNAMRGLDKAALALTGRMNLLKVAAVGALGIGAGYETLRVMGHLVTKGAELTHQQSLLRRAGVTSQDVLLRTAEAYNVALTVQGTKVADNLKMFGQLRSQVSSDEQAAAILPYVAQMGVLLENATGQKSDHLAQTMMRVLEMRGQIFGPDGHTMDLDKVRKELAMAFQAMTTSHGLVTPATLLGFQQQAGPAGSAMSPESFYRTMPTLMQTMGGFRGGTAIASLFSQMVGGVMTKRSAIALEGLGLLDPANVHKGGGGTIIIDAGAIKGFDPSNPFGFGAVLKQAILARPGGNIGQAVEGALDPKIVQQLYRTLGRETTRRAMAEFIQLAPTFERDYKLRMQAMSPENAAIEARTDLPLAMKSFRVALDNFETALGAPMVLTAVRMLSALTDQLNRMTAWASTNPAIVQSLGEIVTGFGLLFGVGGVLALGGAAITALGVLAGPLGLAALAAGILLVTHALKPDEAGASPRERIGAGLAPDNASPMAVALRSMLPSTQQVYDAFKEFAPKVVLGLGKALLDLGAYLERGAMDIFRIAAREVLTGLKSIGGIIVDWVKGLPAQIIAGLGSLANIFGNTPEGKAAHERAVNGANSITGGTGYLPDMGGTRPPALQPQSFVPPPAANSNKTVPIVFHLDGREVARGIIPHIGREMDTAPTGRTGFDTRMSPRFGGPVFAA